MIKKILNDKNKLWTLLIIEFAVWFISLLIFYSIQQTDIANIVNNTCSVLFFTTYSLIKTNEVCGNNDITFLSFIKCCLSFAVIWVGVDVMDNYLAIKNYKMVILIVVIMMVVYIIYDMFVITPLKEKNGVLNE